jgi:hypothetical protein
MALNAVMTIRAITGTDTNMGASMGANTDASTRGIVIEQTHCPYPGEGGRRAVFPALAF